ncbi:MAG: AarF/ABC1/UbiB kinase family protein [Alphaproteobacteria bacterium]|nr:AarF/ABC1/UbiB kinase family protein [Alphaproteobacteria bacterium]
MTIRTRLLSRLAATGRIAGGLAVGGARHLAGDDGSRLGEALLAELDTLKGLPMKVGQILSYMDVGLPEATVARLARLQTGREPLPWDDVRAILEASLGRPVDEVFDSFDPVAVASASIGQVHRATLGGRQVAVKVRYPGIREVLASDLARLGPLAQLAGLGTNVDGTALVAELRARMLEECDYLAEARWQARFAGWLAREADLVAPDVHLDLCREDVLVTSWIEGRPLADLRGAMDRERHALALATFPWLTLLRHATLHADPHPGNFVVTDGPLAVLDFGCVRTFEAGDVRRFAALVRADGRDAVLEAACDLGLVPDPDRIDADELHALVRWMFAPYRTARFAFTKAWWHEGRRFSSPSASNGRKMGFPPAWLWLQRTFWGLHAVLVSLDVELALADRVEQLLQEGPCPEPSPKPSASASSTR